MSEKKMACVTGGTGFIGSHIVRLLIEEGHQVRVLHRESSRLIALEGLEFASCIGDVTDRDSMIAAFGDCDWVFHVAAVADYWNADNDWMFTVNVDGTRNVLEAAKATGIQRVIFTSSAATIGLPTDKTPSDENTPFNLDPEYFPYGYSKVLAEEIVQEAVSAGQDVVILNPAVVIGPGDLNVISGSFIVQIAQSQWLTPMSHGGFGITDVRDVASTHLAAAEKGISGERYIISTKNFSDDELFGLIAKTIGVAKPFFTAPSFVLPVVANLVNLLRRIGIQTPVDANQIRLGSRYIYFSASKAHRELHQPQIDIRQSIADTYQWYVENGYIKETWSSKLLRRIGKLWHKRFQ